jgi:hypothetical protein
MDMPLKYGSYKSTWKSLKNGKKKGYGIIKKIKLVIHFLNSIRKFILSKLKYLEINWIKMLENVINNSYYSFLNYFNVWKISKMLITSN